MAHEVRLEGLSVRRLQFLPLLPMVSSDSTTLGSFGGEFVPWNLVGTGDIFRSPNVTGTVAEAMKSFLLMD